MIKIYKNIFIVHVFSARLYGSRSYKQKKLVDVVEDVIICIE
ncbi:hypothetical protein [Hathewaya massiliensis]|nr:hypothetical protein [Hathewaya massiliensis]